MSVQEIGSREEPSDLMASGLGGSGLSTEIKEPLLANYIKSLSCVLFSIQGKTCLRMHQTEKTKFYNLLRHSSQQKTGIQQSVVWQVLQVFGFYFFILTIKVTERRPNKMRMRFIIFRFLSTIFWFILSSLTPAALSCGHLPSNSVSSSSPVTFQYNRLNLKIFLFYRDSVLPRMEWFWSPSLGSNNGSMIVTFGRLSPSSMICSHKIGILLLSF